MAGALGVMLGGRTEYMYGVQERPRLGDGPAPTATDLRRAVRMSVAVQTASAVGSAFLAVALRQGGLLLRRQLGLLRR